jgi:hypothetical protein
MLIRNICSSITTKSYISHDKTMLLSNLINNNRFRSRLFNRIEQDIRWNGNKKQRIQENENDKKRIDSFVLLNSNCLIIRISIKGS